MPLSPKASAQSQPPGQHQTSFDGAHPDSRSRGRFPESLTGLIPTRNRVPSGSHPAAAALQVVATFGHPELMGATLTAGNLTDEEGIELAVLARQATEDGDQFSDDERAGRYERLLGKCAGNESLFAERRREEAAREKLGELTKEARMAALPQRPKYEEPGAVVLPALVFEWLKTSRDASWTIADTGMLVAVLGMFANRDAGLIIGARFERATTATSSSSCPRTLSSGQTPIRI